MPGQPETCWKDDESGSRLRRAGNCQFDPPPDQMPHPAYQAQIAQTGAADYSWQPGMDQ